MAHPSEAELEAFADEELPEPLEHVLRPHIEGCEDCARRVRSLRRRHEEIAEWLRLLDHQPPALAVETLMAPAQSKRAMPHSLIAAGLSALFAAAAAAAVIPGTPVNRYVGRVLASWRQAPAAAPQRPPPRAGASESGVSEPSGVAFVPASDFEVVFEHSQSKGDIRIALRENASVRISSSEGSVAYALDPARVTIDNGDSGGSYEILIPRDAGKVRVRVGTRVVFEKSGPTVSSAAPADSGGWYVIPFLAVTEAQGRQAPLHRRERPRRLADLPRLKTTEGSIES